MLASHLFFDCIILYIQMSRTLVQLGAAFLKVYDHIYPFFWSILHELYFYPPIPPLQKCVYYLPSALGRYNTSTTTPQTHCCTPTLLKNPAQKISKTTWDFSLGKEKTGTGPKFPGNRRQKNRGNKTSQSKVAVQVQRSKVQLLG